MVNSPLDGLDFTATEPFFYQRWNARSHSWIRVLEQERFNHYRTKRRQYSCSP